MSPLASVSAALHSIIPAPVASRSFFTIAAVISIVAIVLTPSTTSYRPVHDNAGHETGRRRIATGFPLNRRRRHSLFPRRRTIRAGAPPAVVAVPAVVAARGLAEAATGDHRVGNLGGEEADGAQRVVVARDDEVDFVRVAVGVDDADDRNLELARLVDGDLFLAGVDDEDGVGQARHVADALEVLLKLALLLLDLRDFLLRDGLVAAVGLHGLEVAEPGEAALNGGEVGE